MLTEDLKDKIKEAFNEIDMHTLEWVLDDYVKRLHKCVDIHGAHVEM